MDKPQEDKYARLERRILHERLDVQDALYEFFDTDQITHQFFGAGQRLFMIMMGKLDGIILTFIERGNERMVTCLRLSVLIHSESVSVVREAAYGTTSHSATASVYVE